MLQVVKAKAHLSLLINCKLKLLPPVGARELLIKHVTSRLIALELYSLHFRSTQLENNKKVT